MDSIPLSWYYSLQCRRLRFMFINYRGKLEQLLRSGEFPLFRHMPVFESEFFQVNEHPVPPILPDSFLRSLFLSSLAFFFFHLNVLKIYYMPSAQRCLQEQLKGAIGERQNCSFFPHLLIYILSSIKWLLCCLSLKCSVFKEIKSGFIPLGTIS